MAKNHIKVTGGFSVIEKKLPVKLRKEAQQIYRKEFEKYLDKKIDKKVCIDKLPLNLLQVPVINEIFPQAKFILALRHPLDAILSCWMQNFQMNSAMANMVDLDRIVEFYCVAMETFQVCRHKYNLKVHEIRYENLVDKLQTEVTELLLFLNLSWEEKMQNYKETAITRGRINTPSYSQVTQPLYQEAIYRWENYGKHLEKYMAKVEP